MSRHEPRILQGPPMNIDALNTIILPQILYDGLRNAGDKNLTINAEDESRKLYATEVLDKSTRITEFMRSRGIGPGDVITICSENSTEYVLPVLATLFIGAACSPLNNKYTPRELRHILDLTSPRAIFCTVATKDAILEALQHKSSLLLILLPDRNGRETQVNGFQTLSQVIESVPTPTDFKVYAPTDPASSVALIMCSSGTTGLPKGVELTHRNIVALFTMRAAEETQNMPQMEVSLAHLPFFHVIGVLGLLDGIMRSVTIIVFPFFSFETLLRVVQDYKINTLPAVPPIVLALANSPLVSKYDLSSLQYVICGAAPLSSDLQEATKKRFRLKGIRQAYGLTESTLGVLNVRDDYNKPGTSGSAVLGTQIKVIDESGRLLGPYEHGELCIRGPLVMKGYKNNPEATAQAIDKEGWLHTGDVAYYDEDECFFIVDRIKELIKYKAFQVPPAELEGILQTHPGVADAAVVGLPDVEAGELPLAFVVRKDLTVTAKDLVEFIAKNVSPQKRLRGGVRFIEAIPKNPSGKILRRQLRQLLQNKL